MTSKKHTGKVIEGEAVKKGVKQEKDFLQKGMSWLKNFDWEGNLHKIFGVGLLVVAAILLWEFLFGIICLALGVLFVIGFFEGKRKIM